MENNDQHKNLQKHLLSSMKQTLVTNVTETRPTNNNKQICS